MEKIEMYSNYVAFPVLLTWNLNLIDLITLFSYFTIFTQFHNLIILAF